jgi:hypothetical protein
MQGGPSGPAAGFRTRRVGYGLSMSLERDHVRRERLMRNEQLFRDYNNRRVAFEQDADAIRDVVPFVCECGDTDCIEGMEMTVDDYMSAHSAPDLFTVKPGHVFPEAETVVESHDSFWLAEKDGG